jgi:two-component system KDP operon response regulator KdpE
MTRVLVIEDESQIRRFVRLALRDEGYEVAEAGNLKEGLAIAQALRPELVILDLGLPDGDGMDFIPAWRAWSRAPLLVLSACGQETDKVRALDAGADDYLAKPFGVAELMARVRALSRRRGVDEAARCGFGRVAVDLARREVRVAGEVVHLTPIEYRLLTLFLAHPDRVLTHRQLLREIWGSANADSGHTLRVYVGRLRHRLEEDPTQPRHLLTEVGVGYRLETGGSDA